MKISDKFLKALDALENSKFEISFGGSSSEEFVNDIEAFMNLVNEQASRIGKLEEKLNNLKFPVYIRKMWSGAEVQEWLDRELGGIRSGSKNIDMPRLYPDTHTMPIHKPCVNSNRSDCAMFDMGSSYTDITSDGGFDPRNKFDLESGVRLMNKKYSVEPHGDGYAIYLGRNKHLHGLNLGQLSGCDEELAKLIEDSLNINRE